MAPLTVPCRCERRLDRCSRSGIDDAQEIAYGGYVASADVEHRLVASVVSRREESVYYIRVAGWAAGGAGVVRGGAKSWITRERTCDGAKR